MTIFVSGVEQLSGGLTEGLVDNAGEFGWRNLDSRWCPRITLRFMAGYVRGFYGASGNKAAIEERVAL